jgi:hypothetical protein
MTLEARSATEEDMRIRSIVLFAYAAAVLAAGSCSKRDPAVPAERGDPHAAAAAKPGSHEDWCGEHRVPESQCTRCNPDLIAAFKATGDWCDEHGMPESQCGKCNPGLEIVRPAKPETK